MGSKDVQAGVFISSGAAGAVSITSSKNSDSVSDSVTVGAGSSNAVVGAGAYVCAYHHYSPAILLLCVGTKHSPPASPSIPAQAKAKAMCLPQ